MSAHGDHDEAHADGEHDHDDHHAQPALEEPATPLWLTLLGVGLFLAAGVVFVATRDEGKTTAELTAAQGDEAPAADAAPAPNPAAVRPGAAPANPAAAQAPAAARTNAQPRPAAPPTDAVPPVRRGSQRPGHEGHDHD